MERWTPKLKQDKDGEYVLYTDHIAETRKLIDTYDLLISELAKALVKEDSDGHL